MKYDGWLWDPAKREWIETDVEEVTVEWEEPKYPKPTEEPRPEQPLYVPGWYWDGRARRWEEETMPYREVWVTPERPPMPTEWPSRTQPAEILGWRYSFEDREWQEVEMEKVPEMREMERGPKPEYPPGPGVPDEVEGWSWSRYNDEWVATIISAQRVGFEPPRSFPPPVSLAVALEFAPTDLEMIVFMRQLMDGGMSWVQANDTVELVRSRWTDLAVAARVAAREATWQLFIQQDVANKFGHKIPLGAVAFLGTVTALTGWLIGSIMERLTFVDADMYTLTERVNTYLLGPDNWVYSKHIGTSRKGRPYYSSCEGIGTEYVRYKRAPGKGKFDTIDFLGGFVESGYDFPYFVKYTWSHWSLEYVGFLINVGADKYMLQEGHYDPAERLWRGFMFPFEEWCQDFHWYL